MSVGLTLRAGKTLFALMSVFPQFFLAFMRGNLSKFAFSSAGHLTLLCYGIKTAQAVVTSVKADVDMIMQYGKEKVNSSCP